MALTYNNELKLQVDDPATNPGAVLNLIDHIRKTMDYTKFSTDDEKTAMKYNMELALNKFKPPEQYQRKMVFSNFRVTHQIGSGGFGKVWKAFGNYTGDVAIKQLPVDVYSFPHILKERDTMIALQNKRICKLHGSFFYRDAFLVMDLCYGNVASLLKQIDPINAIRFSVHLLEGLRHIHSLNILHADIKPDNCLIKRNNCLVITDFGSAFALTKLGNSVGGFSKLRLLMKSHYAQQENGDRYINCKETFGSTPYQDYKALKLLKFHKRTDIFAAGCVIFEMDTHAGLLMYPQRKTHPRSLYIDALENGRVSNLPAHLNPAPGMEREIISKRALRSKLGFLIQKLISEEYRLTAEEALVDPTLKSILSNYGLSPNTTSCETVYVTREYSIDTCEKFRFLSERSDSEKMQAAFVSFYFDNNDQGLEEKPRIFRSDAVYSDSAHNHGGEGEGVSRDESDPNYEAPTFPRPTEIRYSCTDANTNNGELSSWSTRRKRHRCGSLLTQYNY